MLNFKSVDNQECGNVTFPNSKRKRNLSQLKELPTLLRDETSAYFNVIMVESMTSGVMSVHQQCSIHDYKVLPVPFDISFCF